MSSGKGRIMPGNAPKLDDLQSRVVKAVSGQRLWERLMTMARIGATEKGGVNRQALAPEDAEARRLFADWGRELGFRVFPDQVGNVFIHMVLAAGLVALAKSDAASPDG